MDICSRLWHGLNQLSDFFLRLRQGQVLPIQNLVHGFYRGDPLRREAASLQTFQVHCPCRSGLPLTHHKWRQISKQQRTHGGHAMGTDSHKLVNHRKATQYGPIPDVNMPRQLGIIGKNGVVADDAIMCYVHIGHDPVVIAHPGYPGVTWRPDVQGAKLPNGISIANNQLTRFTVVLFVLGYGANRAELENLVVTSDGRVAFDDTVGTNAGSWANGYVGTNYRVRPHRHRGG